MICTFAHVKLPMHIRLQIVKTMSHLVEQGYSQAIPVVAKACIICQCSQVKAVAAEALFRAGRQHLISTFTTALGDLEEQGPAIHALDWLMCGRDKYAVELLSKFSEIEKILSDEQVVTSLIKCAHGGAAVHWEVCIPAWALLMYRVPAEREAAITALCAHAERGRSAREKLMALNKLVMSAPQGHEEIVATCGRLATGDNLDMEVVRVAEEAVVKLGAKGSAPVLDVILMRLDRCDASERLGALRMLQDMTDSVRADSSPEVVAAAQKVAQGDWPRVRCLAVEVLDSLGCSAE